MITESRVCYDGVHTRVLSVEGDGPPIVLLAGYGDSADSWREVLERLKDAGRQAFSADLPGFGKADPRQPGPLVPQFDALVDAIVAAHGPIVLVGNSLGAATALHAANRHPGRVLGVVAIDDPVNARRRVSLATFALWKRSLPKIMAMPIPARALRWSATLGLYARTRPAAPEVLAYWTELLSTPASRAAFLSDALGYAAEIARGHDHLNITCPVLIVHGRKDIIIPVAASRVLHAKIPGSELVILPRSGHCPQLDDPDELTKHLLDFVARVEDDHDKAG